MQWHADGHPTCCRVTGLCHHFLDTAKQLDAYAYEPELKRALGSANTVNKVLGQGAFGKVGRPGHLRSSSSKCMCRRGVG
jgi:hypothetical protein